MQCPKCGGELAYEETVSGVYRCPIRNSQISFAEGKFLKEATSRKIRCLQCPFIQHLPAYSRRR